MWFCFRCQVVQDSRSCAVSVTSNSHHISSSASFSDSNSESNCGTRLHPWRLEAPLGQRINISLLDFTGSGDKSQDRDVVCRQYGFILEKANKKNVSIACSSPAMGGASTVGVATERESRSQRDRALYVSVTNKVDIVLAAGNNGNKYNFLLRFNGKQHTYQITLIEPHCVVKQAFSAVRFSTDTFF